MTFADLLAELEIRGVLTRAKDKKTSLRYLASALGYASLEQCSIDDACREEATWATALETHFQALEAQGRTISASTRRNTRNDLRVFFRLADEHGLLTASLPSPLLARSNRHAFDHQQRVTAPYKAAYRNQVSRRYWLKQADWPPEIAQGFQEYRTRCGMRLRETTVQTYVKCLSTYLGYLAHVKGLPLTWDTALDAARVEEFMRWHAARLERTSTVHGQTVAIKMTMIAKVLEHRHAPALNALRKTLKPPAPLHTKRFHWVSLAQLDAIADACLTEGRQPYLTHPTTRSPGAQRAVRFQRGLILKLLVRVPLRQRNVREMQLDKHLYKDHAGHWQLEFSGDDLKIGHRREVVNTYAINLSTYCPAWTVLLEEWLRVYRPRLPNAAASRFVFLTLYSKPHIAKTLHADLSSAVAMRTGQRFYPHLIRTVWATEYLDTHPGDFATVATMLGNTIAVVMRTYYNIVHKDQHAKAKAFLSSALHTG